MTTASLTRTLSDDTRPAPALLAGLALCSAVGVGTVYLPQSLVSSVAEQFGTTEGTASWIVTAPQIGYAVGILALVPLADSARPGRLLSWMFRAVALCALVAAVAPSLAVLVVASFLMGCATVASPVIGPLAAGRTGAARLGQVNAVVLSACIGGMIVGRGLASYLADWSSWRTPYVVAAVLAAGCAWLGRRLLDDDEPTAPVARRRLDEPWRRWRRHPRLRRSAVYQACVFAAFTGTWTTLGIAAPHLFGSATSMAWISLVALATMVLIPWSGRAVDRWGEDRVTNGVLASMVLAALLLSGPLWAGPVGLFLLVAGVLVLDLAMQTGTVANATRIFRIDPTARAAMNTAHMTFQFAAGGLGSLVAAHGYEAVGWWSLPAMMGLLTAIAGATRWRDARPHTADVSTLDPGGTR